MKNCNCNKKPEPVVPCSNPCDRRDHVIKLFVDECSGRPVDPVTVATAVFTEDCKSVQEMLDALADAKADLEQKLANLENDTMNVDNHQSLLYRLRSIESLIQDLRNLLSLLGSYTNLVDRVTNIVTDLAFLQNKVNNLEDQVTDYDYTSILESILNQLSENKETFDSLLEILVTNGCGEGGGEIDLNALDSIITNKLRNYYDKNTSDSKYATKTALKDYAKTSEVSVLKSKVESINNNLVSNFGNKLINESHLNPVFSSLVVYSNTDANRGKYYVLDTQNDTPTFRSGDVTGDNKVDVEDVNAVINIILKLKTPDDYPGDADVTGDNKIDVEDVNVIINKILNV